VKQPPEIDWQRVRTIFEDAVLRPPEERQTYAKELCVGDESIWAEVSSLLDSHESSESFLETPAVAQVVENIQADENQLAAGQRLLHYEILSLIGSGGMGEVYLARDTRLGRNVAIKLLRQDLLPHFRASERLLREARASALLEHPNICQIHDILEADGFSFIVMQHVVGTTLDEILSGRGVDAATALDIAAQVAEGLAEAHRQGIVHRDIKPANIIVSDKGDVKILDFGLAKFLEAESGADAVNRMESTGGVMGTVPYMSPEQLRGDPVDARTDVFSFGAMLFEMLCGVSAFGRKSNEETISAILSAEPDWSLLPPSLKHVLQRCLAKDPSERYAWAGEVAQALSAARKHLPEKSLTKSRTTGGQRFDAETDPKLDAVTLPNIAEHQKPASEPAEQKPRRFFRRFRLFGLFAILFAGSAYGGYILYNRYYSGQVGSLTATIMAKPTPTPCGAVWDAVDEFSFTENNSDRTWQYGFTDPDGNGFTLYEQTSMDCDGPQEAWFIDTDSRVARSVADQGVFCHSCFYMEPGFLTLHPNKNGNKSALRWKAPMAGTFLVQGEWRDHDWTSTDISIVKNESISLFSDNISDITCAVIGVRKPFSIEVTVAAGDTIDFRVGPMENYFSDSTGLSVKITENCNSTAMAGGPGQPSLPNLVVIPGGTFMMGNSGPEQTSGEERPVTVKSFKMEKYEVTNGEYYQFITQTGYENIPSHWVDNKPITGEEKLPVRFVNTADVNQFIAWRSLRDGVKYRLPTEEEWEYAARNGAKNNMYPWGNEFRPECAVVYNNGQMPPFAAVGTASCPNEWGVYDLIGNVWEWTSSAPDLPASSSTPAMYVIRSSSIFPPKGQNRPTSMTKFFVRAEMRDEKLGFRLVTDE